MASDCLDPLEECISKALPTQPISGVKTLAKTLRDIGVETLEDLQYVEASDLSSVLKPIQIRKLLQQTKLDLNQPPTTLYSLPGQIQNMISKIGAPFQNNNLQQPVIGNLHSSLPTSGVCVQLPLPKMTTSNVSKQTIVENSHNSIMYPHNNTSPLLPLSMPGSSPTNQSSPQLSNVTQYQNRNIPQYSNMNNVILPSTQVVEVTPNLSAGNNPVKDISSGVNRARVRNQSKRDKLSLMASSLERDDNSSKGISPSLSSLTRLCSVYGGDRKEVVEISPQPAIDNAGWNTENSEPKLSAADPIIVSDDSNCSTTSETLNSKNFDKMSDNSLMTHTSELLPLANINNDKQQQQQQQPLDIFSVNLPIGLYPENNSNMFADENSEWVQNFQIPIDKMPPALIHALKNKQRPESNLRREMIRVVVAEAIKFCARPNRRQLFFIAHKMVTEYPESLMDDTLSPNGRQTGFEAILKQLQSRVENINRFDRGQFLYQKKLMSWTKTQQKSDSGNQKSSKLLNNYGCINWQPLKLPPNETKWSLRMKQDLLRSIYSSKWDVEFVEKDMITTFFFQRKDINNGASITTLHKDWPFLFEEIGLMVHFKELTTIDMKSVINDFLNNSKVETIINVMKSLFLITNITDIEQILQTAANYKKCEKQNSENDINVALMMQLLMVYLGEDIQHLFPLVPVNYTVTDLESSNIPETPCLIACGDSLLNSCKFLLCVDGTVVNEQITSFVTGLCMMFASYYCFNICYNQEAPATLEFVQRCLFDINPMKGSKFDHQKFSNKHFVVHPKINTLLKSLIDLGFQVSPELSGCVSNRKSRTPDSSDISRWSLETTNNSNDSDLPALSSLCQTTAAADNSQNFPSLTNKPSDENELVTNPSISIECNEITSQGLSEEQQQQQQQQQHQQQQQQEHQQQQQEHQQQQLTSANISNMPASCEAPLVISVEEVQDFELPDQNFRYNIMNTTNELQENPTKFVPKIKNRLKHCRSVRGHGANKKPKEWMREYWRIKKRESRARQDYWRKRVLHESIPGQASTTVPTGEPICNQAFDINTNIPCDDGQPNKKNVQLHSPPALVQPQTSVVPTPSPVPKPPTYKFQMQHHQSCVMTQLYQMWKSRLFCNAAISNGTHTILVHRDLLIATCTKLLEIPNTDVLKGEYLQLTFTPDIQEEALWAFCTYMYEGVLVLNSDILYNMECIAKILGVYNILSLVDRYKQCTMQNQSNTSLKSSNEEQMNIYFNYQITNRFQMDNDCDGGPSQSGIKVKQETDPISCSSQNTIAESQNNLNKSDSFLNYEHVDNKMTLTGLQYQKTICNLSQMITGMISHNQPDYSTSVVIEVEVDSLMSNSCPNVNTQSNTTLSPVSLTTVSGEQLPLDLPHTQIKTE
ncbi:Hypothetical predicted protein [Octopus vulgaris]|nr:Hypothetical predicted protein [Octopus vulgaris]